MTTGFFMHDKLQSRDFATIKPFLTKIFKIYIIGILLYLPLNFYMYKTGQVASFY